MACFVRVFPVLDGATTVHAPGIACLGLPSHSVVGLGCFSSGTKSLGALVDMAPVGTLVTEYFSYRTKHMLSFGNSIALLTRSRITLTLFI